MSEPQLVVMAAGIGSRYGGLKQIDPVGPSGEILIDYAIYDALKAGFKRIVFIIRHHFADDFMEMVGRKMEKRAEVRYVYQEVDSLPRGRKPPEGRRKPWGTGHAALVAAPCIDAPSAIINADDFYGAGAFRQLYTFLSAARDTDRFHYCMTGYKIENTLTDHGHVARGVCTVAPDGRLRSIVERTKIRRGAAGAVFENSAGEWEAIPSGSVVSMNMWGVTPSFYSQAETRFESWLDRTGTDGAAEFFLPTIINELVAEEKADVTVMTSADCWYGVTYREDRPIVANAILAMIAKGVYPPKLWT